MLRGSEAHQERVLSLVGFGVLLCVVLAIVFATTNPFGEKQSDLLSVSIDTPYIGQGIQAGSAVVMHGVEVGTIASVTSLPSGGVRLVTELQRVPTTGLTDTVNVDFRPVNYFGVPGVNIIPNSGGQALRNGTQISLVPKGNFTLSELLSQLGGVSAGALSPQLITLVDRATRYTDGLTPLLETVRNVTTAVADVQTVPTEQLLANTATISASFPAFANTVIDTGSRLIRFDYYPGHVPSTTPAASGTVPRAPFLQDATVRNLQDEPDTVWNDHYIPFLQAAAVGLFGAVGKLETTHVDDLYPLINGIKSLTDTVPSLVRPEAFGQTMVELRTRFEKLYAGNGQQRALQVRVVLDSLPGIAAPLGIGVEGNAAGPVDPSVAQGNTAAVVDAPVPADGGPVAPVSPAVVGSAPDVPVQPAVAGSPG